MATPLGTKSRKWPTIDEVNASAEHVVERYLSGLGLDVRHPVGEHGRSMPDFEIHDESETISVEVKSFAEQVLTKEKSLAETNGHSDTSDRIERVMGNRLQEAHKQHKESGTRCLLALFLPYGWESNFERVWNANVLVASERTGGIEWQQKPIEQGFLLRQRKGKDQHLAPERLSTIGALTFPYEAYWKELHPDIEW